MNKRVVMSILSVVAVAALLLNVSGLNGTGTGYTVTWVVAGLCLVIIGILAVKNIGGRE